MSLFLVDPPVKESVFSHTLLCRSRGTPAPSDLIVYPSLEEFIPVTRGSYPYHPRIYLRHSRDYPCHSMSLSLSLEGSSLSLESLSLSLEEVIPVTCEVDKSFLPCMTSTVLAVIQNLSVNSI